MTEKLKKILFSVVDKTESTAGAQRVLLPLANHLEKFPSDKNLAEFCAQCAHESGGFRRLTENLNYSAEGLSRTWPNRFAIASGAPNLLASDIARKPELIANYAYANRMGNGSPDSGDGWKYRGRGIIQLTGKNNYQAVANELGIDCVNHPEMIAEYDRAIDVAVWFWFKNGCDKAPDFHAQTRKINGGLNGIKDRIARRDRALTAVGL